MVYFFLSCACLAAVSEYPESCHLQATEQAVDSSLGVSAVAGHLSWQESQGQCLGRLNQFEQTLPASNMLGYQLSAENVDILLGRAGYLSKHVALHFAGHRVNGEYAWVLRRGKGAQNTLDRVCLRDQVRFQNQNWQFMAKSLEVTWPRQYDLCRVNYVYLGDGYTYWGQAREATYMSDGHFVAKDALLSACHPKHVRWHLMAGKLAYDTHARSGVAEDVSFYFSGMRFWRISRFYIGEDVGWQQSQWLTPRVSWQSAFGPRVILPYQWRWTNQQRVLLMPEYSQARKLGFGLAYHLKQPKKQVVLQQNWWPLDVYRVDGESHRGRWITDLRLRADVAATDAVQLWVLRGSDGDVIRSHRWPEGLSMRLNQPLPSVFSWQHQGQKFQQDLTWRWHQRFSGSQPIAFALTFPVYDVLPSESVQGTFGKKVRLNYQFGFDRFVLPEPHRPADVLTGARAWGQVELAVPLAWHQWRGKTRLGVWQHQSWVSLPTPSQSQRPQGIPQLLAELNSPAWQFWTSPHWAWGLAAFYAWVPERSQDQWPNFTTNRLIFPRDVFSSFNRFSGVDRMGDRSDGLLALNFFYQHPDGVGKSQWQLAQNASQKKHQVLLADAGWQDPVSQHHWGSTWLNYSRDLAYQQFSAFFSYHAPTNHVEAWRVHWSYDDHASNRLSVLLGYDQGQLYRQAIDSQVWSFLGHTQLDLQWRRRVHSHWFGEFSGQYGHELEKHIRFRSTVGYQACCWEVAMDVVQNREAKIHGMADFIQGINLNVRFMLRPQSLVGGIPTD